MATETFLSCFLVYPLACIWHSALLIWVLNDILLSAWMMNEEGDYTLNPLQSIALGKRPDWPWTEPHWVMRIRQITRAMPVYFPLTATTWLLSGLCVYWIASVVSDPLWPYGLYSARLLCWWDSPGKNTGVGCHALLQGIFPTQGSSLHLLGLAHWQAGSLPLVPPEKPYFLV